MSNVTARDAILAAVRAARPPSVDAPPARVRMDDRLDATSRADVFARAVTTTSATVIHCTAADASLKLHANVAGAIVWSLVPDIPSTAPAITHPHALSTLDVLVCSAALGVAENGAVWIATSDVMHRAALFLAARVIIVVRADTIVATLHDAYEQLDVRATAFGVFVAGPSKTADIEQAMVIGAHGPKELTVMVTWASVPGMPPG